MAMGLLDMFKRDGAMNQRFNAIANDPASMAVLAGFTTGQGGNPWQNAMGAYQQTAAQQAERQEAHRQQQMQQALLSQFGGGQGGAQGGGLPDMGSLAAYAAGGGKGASQLIDLYKFGKEGIQRSAGNYYIDPVTGQQQYMAKVGEGMTINPDGSVSNQRGYIDALGQAEAAKEWAKVAPQIRQHAAQSGIDYEYDRGMAGYQSGLRTAEDKAKQTYGAQLDPMQTYDPNTGNMVYSNRYNVATGQGGQGGAIAQQNPARAQYQLERSKANAANYQSFLDSASQAGGTLSLLDRFEGLMENVDGGKGTEAMMAVASLAKQVGIDIDPNLDSKEAMISISNRLALDMHEKGTGELTDSDMQIFLQSVPTLNKQPGGNRKVMETMAAFAERKQAESELVQKYVQINGHLDDKGIGLLNQWRKRNPIKW